MASHLWSSLLSFSRNRWAILVASIWIQGCSGVGYTFGSISPVIKTTLGYNQRQINILGVAKDMGDSVGLAAGTLSEVLPGWGLLLIGTLHNVVGYGCLWLIITQRLPSFPLWMICILIFVGTNGETYLNTADLVVCVRNFPRSRGPVVGILKGFTGLCGAIFTQIYATFLAPDQAAFLFMVAVGPGMVVIALMFIIRPIPGMGVAEDSRIESLGFSYIYAVCLLLAAYLMGIMLVQDLVEVSNFVSLMMTVVLGFILFLPLATPSITTWLANKKASESSPSGLSDIEGSNDTTRPLLTSTAAPPQQWGGVVFDDVAPSEMEDEKPQGLDLLPEHMQMRKLAELRQRLVYAAAEGAVRVKRKKGPRRGQDFTLFQALVKADFWLLFWTLFCAAGSGLMVIDNLGQISNSLGYDNAQIFVSMISIWNFLGRLAGGYLSELASRDYALPRPLVMGLAQAEMAVGHLLMAMAWPGALYVGTLLVGSGYGAHWAIVPASVSELFGLKNFAILYNFITIALPSGSLFFSVFLAGTLYDWEAEKQQSVTHIYAHHLSNNSSSSSSGSHIVEADSSLTCTGAVCFRITFLVMTAACILGIVLSMVLSYRTRTVYVNLYGTTKQQPPPRQASSKEEEG